MRLLLDTHALLWWLDGDRHLSPTARSLIGDENTTVFVSAASAWEISTKVRIGKLPGAVEVAEQFEEVIGRQGFAELGITVAHARLAGLLPGEHRDPFDRMLIAQAQIEGLPLVSNERLFDRFGIRRTW
ncbi:MAG: type II toxin-antitoxin system VapC family toxin [Candidatus Competibacteraceae bacterium]|jgi:PIN domain nuclease of toxin-antitoxin system|nr:type II toxin-antitoxin system VapC family toxin [Candidatus Competibacteraceae bacterium]